MAVSGKKAQQQLSASISLASDEDLKVYCIPCDRAGPRLPAFGFCQDCDEHLCQNCFNHHKKATPCMHHVLLDKGAMPKTIKHSSKSAPARKPDDLTQPCLKHKKKMIEFYCQDHRVLLCSVCATLEHTPKSCHVDYITDVSEQVVDSQEFKDILKHMDAIIQHCQKVKTECQKLTENSNTSLSEILNAIKKYRQDINKRIDELQNEVENKAKDLLQQNIQRLQTTDTICDDVTESVKALSDNIKRDNTSKQADKLFIRLKTAENEIIDHETCINDLTIAGDVNAYHFKPNQAISTVLQNETYLGTLEEKILSTPIQNLNIHVQKPPTAQKTQTPTKLLSAKSKTTEFSHQDEICVKTRNDKVRCWITGMTLLNPDQLVVADFSNNSVKLVDVNSKTVSSAVKLSSGPYGIASVTSNQLAVTLPYEKQIQFLSVSSNKLSQAHMLKVDWSCKGISFYQNKLVVSYTLPGKLEILDMKGTVLNKVTTNASGSNIFSHPHYVQVNSNSIYVSDSGTTTVTMINWQGKVMGSYGGFGCYSGLTLSADGTVFVCDYNKNSITEISGDCSTGKVVIQDVNRPLAVCWCDESHKLYIGRDTWSEDDNIIQVYNKS